jgi:sirohydrochlorin cobaltochelatase
MSKIGVMICGHGSRDEVACRELSHVVDLLRARLPEWPVELGYLEFARPILREGLDRLRERGVQRVLALPAMLFAAGHVKNDVPSVLNTYATQHRLRIDMARDLGIDAKLLEASRERIEAALDGASGNVPRGDTLLVLIGRGTSDSDANGNVAKVARMLWEGMGFGHAELGYSGVAHPRTEVALERAARLGFKRIVVFPYFLFSGVLVNRIYAAADDVAARHPEIEIVKARYLDDHPLVVETMVERIRGVLDGDTAMNCALCKYRTRIIGYEADLGAPQESHHHHAEGIGTGGHHHGDGHSHHHHGHGNGHHEHDGVHGHHHKTHKAAPAEHGTT